MIARLKESKERSNRDIAFEAKRLKSLVGTWRSIPPPAEARREMLSRVARLTARCPVPGTGHDDELEAVLGGAIDEEMHDSSYASTGGAPVSGPRLTNALHLARTGGAGRPSPSITDMPAVLHPSASTSASSKPVARRPSFKELAAVKLGDSSQPAESVVIRTRMLPWRPVRDADGVDIKSIRRAGARPGVTLIRLDAGSSIRIAGLAHVDVFVLSGDIMLDGQSMHRGDLYTGRLPPADGADAQDQLIETDHGAELMVCDAVGLTPWT